MTIPIQIRKLAYRQSRGLEIASHDHGFSVILQRNMHALHAPLETIEIKKLIA
jgi:hypothetical protein